MDVVSSSSTSIPAPKHDVFLSFRGEDTRSKFTSHLHAKLIQKNIETYIDDRLSKGDEISPALINAIQGSRISIIIFSENYAFSSWCLDEVVCILKCRREHAQIVVPVFYNVDPSHVRKQLDSYEAAFAKHEERYVGRTEKVDEWRAALTEVASIAGWDSQNYNGTESEFVEEIVNGILKKLNGMSVTDDEFKDLVGIDKSIEEMEQLLCINESPNVRVIGIWGMGGLGKTTLARVIFKRLSSRFQGCCFLENVREESGKHDGLKGLRKKLFSESLEEKDLNAITSFAKERLRRRKVLIVLDDVDDPEQLEVLVADHHWFGPGSRIVVTTRDAQVLRDRADEIYELKGLAFDNAFQLFNLNAFKRNSPTADDVMLSQRVVNYAKGNPLALKVLGSFLRSRIRENWEIELNKLKEVPNERIHNILKISFDGLDVVEKAIFLDIVCFFTSLGVNCRNFVECRLGVHRSHVKAGIDSLIDKSLITVKENKLVMHDLLREMGWEIVRQQCFEEPGKRSRLWSEEDVYHVLKNNTGTPNIQGISCDIRMIDSRDLSPTAFKEMRGLWILVMTSSIRTKVPHGFQYLPDSLKCLVWYNWPWKSLPSEFVARNLVQLRMPFSNLRKLWNGVQNLGKLKHVDLSHSYSLTEISALSHASNLEIVNLSFCTSLQRVPSLRFRNRNKSTSLDQSINVGHKCSHSECGSLGQLKLDYCSNLQVVEKISGNVKEVHLSSTSFKKLPSSIFFLDNLEYLNLNMCRFLKNLPSHDIQKLKSLKRLNLSGCSSFDELSVLPRNIIELDLSGTAIEQLPSSSIEYLSSLEKLNLSNCKRLKSLPTNIYKLESLKSLDLKGCRELEIFPEILEPMEHLGILDLQGTGIQVLSSSFENHINYSMYRFHFLTSLNLSSTKLSKMPNEIGQLSSLEILNLRGTRIKGMPVSIKNLSNLTDLLIFGCESLNSLPELPLSLECLDARGCVSLKKISNSRDALIQGLRSGNHVKTYGKFFYDDCFELYREARENMVREFQLRTFDTAIKSSMLSGGLKKSQYHGVGISYPGNKIPMWFTYQSKGSRIKVKLASHWKNTGLLGFALCVVAKGFPQDLKISCTAAFNSNRAERYKFHYNSNPFKPKGGFLNFPNVYMWYNHENYHDFRDAVEVSFHFRCHIGSMMTAYGVRLLYLQDAEEVLGFGKSNFAGAGAVNSDTCEPHPNRIKTSNFSRLC